MTILRYINVNEEGEPYDSHETREAAEAVQAEFPNDTIVEMSAKLTGIDPLAGELSCVGYTVEFGDHTISVERWVTSSSSGTEYLNEAGIDAGLTEEEERLVDLAIEEREPSYWQRWRDAVGAAQEAFDKEFFG